MRWLAHALAVSLILTGMETAVLMAGGAPPAMAACNCPDDLDSAGRRCGKRAASEKAGGRNPACYGAAAPAPLVSAPVVSSTPNPFASPSQEYVTTGRSRAQRAADTDCILWTDARGSARAAPWGAASSVFDDTIAGLHVLLVGFEGVKPADDFLLVRDGLDTMVFAAELSNVDLFMACTSIAGTMWDRFESWRDVYRNELG